MAVPRNRLSNQAKNARRSHHAKRSVNTAVCPSCGADKLPHRICPACGEYRGKSFAKNQEEQ